MSCPLSLQHFFCKTCGICSFYVPRSNPDGYAITVHCLDPGTLRSVVVNKADGQHWEDFMAKSDIRKFSEHYFQRVPHRALVHIYGLYMVHICI
jgi:hypothetical protein